MDKDSVLVNGSMSTKYYTDVKTDNQNGLQQIPQRRNPRRNDTSNDQMENRESECFYNNIEIKENYLFVSLLLKTIGDRQSAGNDKFLQCDICQNKYSNRTSMAYHMKVQHTPQWTKKKRSCFCEICGKYISDRSNLKPHMRLHTGEKPYACTFENCNKTFSVSNDRNRHMSTHLLDKPFKCDQCQQAFGHQSYLRTHKNNCHKDQQRRIPCTECQQSFKSRATLSKHMRIHTGERPYQCQFCDFTFRQRGAMRAHMNIHTDSRPFKCGGCDRGFHSSAARRSHEKHVHNIQ